ncbi:MAG: Asp23/Gls24 family envelope stress response protein [Clostridiaceae bacterium]|mgnify:CR=1 FL=1|nr:Asp23/Gls24 family envelope stress response protein [Clostridiaceae bacterium]
MKLIAFVGTSGSGKSHRALWVARENNLDYIIDDGLLIHENTIIAGKSAKKAPTKISSVKVALFYEEEHRNSIKKAISEHKPKGILVLGTSDGMVDRIASVLELGEYDQRIYIEDVASPYEIEQAKKTRIDQGKHVIPVPAMQLKKQFSGYFLDPLQLFRRKGKGQFQNIGEKSVVRPTFSYIGNYTISDYAIYQLVNYNIVIMPQMEKVTRFRTSNSPDGLYIDMDVIMVFGYNLLEAVKTARDQIIKELDRFAGFNVNAFNINVKSLVFKKGTPEF